MNRFMINSLLNALNYNEDITTIKVEGDFITINNELCYLLLFYDKRYDYLYDYLSDIYDDLDDIEYFCESYNVKYEKGLPKYYYISQAIIKNGYSLLGEEIQLDINLFAYKQEII